MRRALPAPAGQGTSWPVVDRRLQGSSRETFGRIIAYKQPWGCSMPETTDRRHGTMFGALLLIALGALFLYANHRPDFDVWFFLGRYWPLILIFLGLGKLWDYFWHRSHPDSPRSGEVFGILFAVLILALILAVAVHHPRHWGTRSFPHETQSV